MIEKIENQLKASKIKEGKKVYSFVKNNYNYRFYINCNILTIEKEDIKNENFQIEKYIIN